jgi:hypothetical protein
MEKSSNERQYGKVMKYEEPSPITREDVRRGLESRSPGKAAGALIRMALHEPDWEWAERVSLHVLEEDDRPEVKTAALKALGHLARRFRTLHLDVVLLTVNKLLAQSPYKGAAEDVLDDIAMFIKT